MRLLQLIGILALMATITRLFGVFKTVITTDSQWLFLLISGTMCFFLGLYIEKKDEKPESKHHSVLLKTQLNSIKNIIYILIIVLLMLLFGVI